MLRNLIVLSVLALSGVFLSGISWFVASPVHGRYKVRQDRPSKITEPAHRRSAIVNSIVSTGTIFVAINAVPGALFSGAPRAPWRIAVEVAGILLAYDLGYYLMHRFAFHAWSFGSRIHAVHHRIRTPYARDSLYIHPIETLCGVTLLMACTWAVGPVGIWSFAIALLVYSVLNLLIHSALHLPFFPFHWASALASHHDVHHSSMKGGYYASITPLWDFVFRTAR